MPDTTPATPAPALEVETSRVEGPWLLCHGTGRPGASYVRLEAIAALDYVGDEEATHVFVHTVDGKQYRAGRVTLAAGRARDLTPREDRRRLLDDRAASEVALLAAAVARALTPEEYRG